ncbi:para-nitrobenzyl esterase [Hyaloscypha variabilis F]|uniref:Para-nitrobenzyl esterase n=1 Tax=Hyaloscypha variabilis (strain UAMH 11265 / GT02V1 / F) TaxID=1149755 RepID=A0A2J6QZX3_HYAVF|nr:para-nitrobenzyl esterase [Hyaloscypha variabilis F]
MRGLLSEDGKTVQFRGIKYASIPGRWEDPVLANEKLIEGDGEFDATKHGPSCPQHPAGYAYDLSLVGDVALTRVNEEQSEFECLNLIVVVPVESVGKAEKLPVMVWIHGGSLSVGSSTWPQYDISKFVGQSVDAGKPVVGVSISYRLGIFGFLASDELQTSGNYGLKDQACAFKWVKKNISEFGGDPTRVTAFGESAGSIFISTLLLTKEPIFNRACMMSGDTTLRRPRTMEWQNTHYQANIKLLGLEKATGEARKAELYNMSASEITAKLPAFQHWSPTVDGEFISQEVTLGILSDVKNPIGKPAWCEAVMVGDVEHDGTCLKARIMDAPNIITRLENALTASLDSAEAERLLQKYSLAGNLNVDQQYIGLLNLSTDLRFHFPTVKVAEGWEPSKCLRYHFHQPNEIAGTYKGFVSHELDVAYLLQNFGSAFSTASQKLGKKMASAWIDFAYGDKINDGKGDVLIVGPGEKFEFVKEEGYDAEYRGGRVKLLQEIGWEKCFKLGELLQGVYSENMT